MYLQPAWRSVLLRRLKCFVGLRGVGEKREFCRDLATEWNLGGTLSTRGDISTTIRRARLYPTSYIAVTEELTGTLRFADFSSK